MFLACMLATSQALAGGGGESSGFDPSGLILLALLALGCLAVYLVFWCIAGCFDRARRARIARAWIAELYKPLPPPYREPVSA